jgi:hypothetical protein
MERLDCENVHVVRKTRVAGWVAYPLGSWILWAFIYAVKSRHGVYVHWNVAWASPFFVCPVVLTVLAVVVQVRAWRGDVGNGPLALTSLAAAASVLPLSFFFLIAGG